MKTVKARHAAPEATQAMAIAVRTRRFSRQRKPNDRAIATQAESGVMAREASTGDPREGENSTPW